MDHLKEENLLCRFNLQLKSLTRREKAFHRNFWSVEVIKMSATLDGRSRNPSCNFAEELLGIVFFFFF